MDFRLDDCRGNGSGVRLSRIRDCTGVPFCVWVAAHHLDNFVEALAKTICVGGDCDTNAAMVGWIVALSAGPDEIPADWLSAREPIQM